MSFKKWTKSYNDTILLDIPGNGVSDTQTLYYTLLEKNYLPVEHIENINTAVEWLALSLDTDRSNTHYNRLSILALQNPSATESRTATIEFKSSVSTECNSIFVNITLAPSENIAAFIKFVPLSLDHVISDDNELTNNLTTSGDALHICIRYAGILYSPTNEKMYITTNKVRLYVNDGGNLVAINQNKVVSKTETADYTEIIYKLDECILDSKDLTFTCKFVGESIYSVSDATVSQSPNSYDLTINAINDNGYVDIICMCRKNNVYVTDDLSLIVELYDRTTPIVIYDEIDKIIGTNSVTYKMHVSENTSLETRKLNVYAKYGSRISASKTIVQNSRYNYINVDFENPDLTKLLDTVISLTGLSHLNILKFYIGNTTEKHSSYTDIIDGNTETYKLSYTTDLDIFDTHIDDSYLYIVLKNNENYTDEIKTLGTITLTINKTSSVFSVQQRPVYINIDIDTNKSTLSVLGTKDDSNALIYFTYMKGDTEETAQVYNNVNDIEIICDQDTLDLSSVTYYKTTIDDTLYIVYSAYMNDDNGIGMNNIQTLYFTLYYKNSKRVGSISMLWNPVYMTLLAETLQDKDGNDYAIKTYVEIRPYENGPVRYVQPVLADSSFKILPVNSYTLTIYEDYTIITDITVAIVVLGTAVIKLEYMGLIKTVKYKR